MSEKCIHDHEVDRVSSTIVHTHPRGVATGGISVYIPQNQSTLKTFMWLFFSCDPEQIRYDICSRVGH